MGNTKVLKGQQNEQCLVNSINNKISWRGRDIRWRGRDTSWPPVLPDRQTRSPRHPQQVVVHQPQALHVVPVSLDKARWKLGGKNSNGRVTMSDQELT